MWDELSFSGLQSYNNLFLECQYIVPLAINSTIYSADMLFWLDETQFWLAKFASSRVRIGHIFITYVIFIINVPITNRQASHNLAIIAKPRCKS